MTAIYLTKIWTVFRKMLTIYRQIRTTVIRNKTRVDHCPNANEGKNESARRNPLKSSKKNKKRRNENDARVSIIPSLLLKKNLQLQSQILNKIKHIKLWRTSSRTLWSRWPKLNPNTESFKIRTAAKISRTLWKKWLKLNLNKESSKISLATKQ